MNDACFFHLENFYEAHLHYPTPLTGPTLCWTNLMRGLLNNSTWTHSWANMMTNAIANSLSNLEARQTILNLLHQNFFLAPPPRLPLSHPPHNPFPLQPIPISPVINPVPLPLPISHVPIHRRGTIIEVYGNQSLTILSSPPPCATELLVSVASYLKYETRRLDYRLTFNPSAFSLAFKLFKVFLHAHPSYLSMNILS